MSTATVRERRVINPPPIANSLAIASLRRELLVHDALRRRWEQIVSKGRA